MTITFYNFSKKKNSTATPSGSGTDFTCNIKTPSSIMQPVVEVSAAAAPLYNYAYMSAFGRYYYVTDIAYNRGLWEISLSVDVLASFKTDIGSTSMYIMRSSSHKNGDLIDTLYPVTADYTVSTVTIAAASGNPWSSGSFVLSVLDGDSNTGNTSYQFSPSEFGNFIQALMATGADSHESVWDAITQSIKITNYEPLKYIGACYWFPSPAFTPGPVTAVTSIKLGNFTATGFSCYPIDGTATNAQTYTVTLPKHPQTTNRGRFCNLEPYSEYSLNLAAFGNIKIDSSACADATSLTITILKDPLTGKARAIIKTNTGAMIANAATQWGVPVMIASGTNVNIGGMGQMIGGAVGATVSAVTGNAAGAVGGLSNYVAGTMSMEKGTYSTVGSTGAMIDFETDMELVARFFSIAADDNANNGRPYCQVANPSTLTGYMEAEKGVVTSSSASRPELDMINSFMEGGFYYE